MRYPQNASVAEELVLKAIDGGVNYFDTAYIYPGSEEVLGRVLHKNNLRDKVNIATKMPLLICKSGKDFDKYFERQLERLKTNYIDFYLMHNLTDLMLWSKLCEWGIEDWIEKKKTEGVIKRIGFSFHGSKNDFTELLHAFEWDFCMIQYNYYDKNYQAGEAGLKAAYAKGIPVFIMEPLLGGKLATGLPKRAVEAFRSSDKSISPAAWAFRWLYNQNETFCLLSGMNSLSMLEENIKTANSSNIGMLSEAEHRTFDEVRGIIRASFKVPCTGCGYCLPCPRHVNIPACFSAYNTYYAMSKFSGFQQYLTSSGITSHRQSSAGQCISCGKCEPKCPQNIEIINSLKQVSSLMEPFWFRWGVKFARKVLGRG